MNFLEIDYLPFYLFQNYDLGTQLKKKFYFEQDNQNEIFIKKHSQIEFGNEKKKKIRRKL